MQRILVLLGIAVVIATTAFSRDGAKNPVVKARMAAMQDMDAQMGLIAKMASGEKPFDAERAVAATGGVAQIAGTLASLFYSQDTDPVSEAKPDVWNAFGDFTAKAKETELAATGADITTLEELQVHLEAIEASCKACHNAYRIKR